MHIEIQYIISLSIFTIGSTDENKAKSGSKSCFFKLKKASHMTYIDIHRYIKTVSGELAFGSDNSDGASSPQSVNCGEGHHCFP